MLSIQWKRQTQKVGEADPLILGWRGARDAPGMLMLEPSLPWWTRLLSRRNGTAFTPWAECRGWFTLSCWDATEAVGSQILHDWDSNKIVSNYSFNTHLFIECLQWASVSVSIFEVKRWKNQGPLCVMALIALHTQRNWFIDVSSS